MSGLDRKIRAGFKVADKYAAEEEADTGVNSEAVLKDTYSLLATARDQDNVQAADLVAIKTPDLLVTGAEAAIKNQEYSIAEEAIHSFFLQMPPQNQFFCRALFIKALIEAQKAVPLSGAEAVRQLDKAISFILQSLEIAKANRPRYDFLIYNASVHYWTVARPLMRTGAYRYAVDSMVQIVEALVEVDDPDTMWRIRYLINLANAHDDADRAAESVQAITDALDLKQAAVESGKELPPALVDELCRVQVHLSKHDSKLLDRAKSEAAEAGDIKTEITITLQCVQSGLTPPEEAEQALRSALVIADPSQAVEDEEEAEEGGKKREPHLESVVEIGRVASSMNFEDLAQKCLHETETKGKQGTQRLRVCTDYLKCELMAREAGAKLTPGAGKSGSAPKLDSRRMEALRLARRVEALKILERALTAARRTGDCNLIQDGCVLAWNLGLDLLQPHLRKHIHRLFSAASTALEEIQSPLTRLRAQLHMEVAKCEVASDFLAKASSQVSKALGMDYGVIQLDEEAAAQREAQEEAAKDSDGDPEAVTALAEAANDSLRPLDRFMRPLRDKLELKGNLYKELDSPEEQALLQLEQAKEAKDSHLKVTMLNKAATMLEEGIKAQEEADKAKAAAAAQGDCEGADADAAGDEGEGDGEAAIPPPTPLMKKRAELWVDIVKMAWEQRMIHLVQKGALYILADKWDLVANKEFVVKQAEIEFIVTESFVEELRQTPTDAPRTETGLDARTLGVDTSDDLEPHLHELKLKVISGFLNGLQKGMQLRQGWIVENAVIYLWNYHLMLFKGKETHLDYVMPELVDALQEASQSLRADFIATPNSALLAAVVEFLALVYEYQEEHPKALEVLAAVIPLGKPLVMKELLAVQARVAAKAGQSVPDAEAVEAQVITTLSKLSIEGPGELDPTAKQDVLSAAIEQMGAVPLPVFDDESTTLEDDEAAMELYAELWTRLARCALELDSQTQAQGCALQAVRAMPESAADRAALPPSVWRWYSVAENLCGQSISAMVSADGQEKALQDKLRVAALQHLCLSASFGCRAASHALVVGAALHFWNVALPLMQTEMSRRLLFPHLQKMLGELAAVGDRSRLDLRVALYDVLFECYTDQKAWEDGLAAVELAFQYVPPAYQKSLWQARVVFMSKLGRSVQEGLSKMKQSDAVLQARVWASLARASTDPSAQLSAYVKALDTLDGRFERLDYVIELSEWYMVNAMPATDVRENLHSAVDMLLDVEEFANDGEDDDEMGGDDSKSATPSRMSRRSGRSGQSSRPRTKGSVAGGGSTRGSVRSSRSRGSTRPGSKARTSKTAGSRTGGGTVAGDDDDMGGYPSALGVSHLERLVRVHAMLAANAESYSESVHCALIAHHYCVRLWQAALAQAGVTARQAEYEALTAEQKEEQSLEEYAASQQAVYACPEDLSQWAYFEVTEEMLKDVTTSAPGKEENCFSQAAFPKAPLTAHYLQATSDLLCEHGYHLHAVPLLLLLERMGAVMEPPMPPLSSLAMVKLASVLDQINCAAQSDAWLAKAGTLGLSTAAAKVYSEEVEQREQQQAGGSGSGSGGGGSGDAAGDDGRKTYACAQMPVREVWMHLAKSSLELGRQRPAIELLNGCARHNAAFEDTRNKAACGMLQSQLLDMAGMTEQAVGALLEAQAVYNLDTAGWYKSTMLLVGYLRETGRKSEAKVAVENAITAFEAASAPKVNPAAPPTEEGAAEHDVQSTHHVAMLQAVQAELLVETVLEQQQQASPWEQTWDTAKELFVAAEGTLEAAGAVRDLITVILKHCALAVVVSKDGDTAARPADLREVVELLTWAEEMAAGVVQSACPPDLNASFNLPCQRLLAEVQLQLASAHIALAWGDADVKQARATIPEVTDTVELWLRDTKPKGLPTEEDMRVGHCQHALMYSTSAYGLLAQHKRAQPAAHALMGRCLKMLAHDADETLGEGAWATPADVLAAPKAEEQEGAAEEEGALEPVYEGVAKLKRLFEPSADEGTQVGSGGPHTMQQAVSRLHASIGEALSMEQFEDAGLAAYEMASAIGWRDVDACVGYLCLYQSCAMRGELLAVLNDAYASRSRERLFISQRAEMQATHLNPQRCAQYVDGEKFLLGEVGEAGTPGLSTAWARLDCSEQDTAAMVRALPEGTSLVLLSHSPDGRELVAAVVGQTKAVARMAMSPAARRELGEIRKGLAGWRVTTAKALLAYCDDAGADGDFEPEAPAAAAGEAEGGDGAVVVAAAAAADGDDDVAEDACEADFAALVARMNALLEPLTSDPALNLAFAGFTAASEDAGEDEDEFTPTPLGATRQQIVILADRLLSDLPLEALSMLDGAASLARDFSLHMLYARLMDGAEPDAEGVTVPKEDIHTVSDAAMGAMVDTRDEDRAPGDDSCFPRATVGDTWASIDKHVGKWGGVVGPNDHIASGQEWQSLLRSAAKGGGGVVYYGMGRALAYCAPALVAGLSISGCKLLMLIDRADNDASNRRQSQLDNQKTAAQLALEQPFQTAALFSLAGVNSVVLNQWSNTLHANRRLVSELIPLMKDNKDLHLSSALQQVVRPPKADKAAGTPDSKAGKKDKKKGKKDGDDVAACEPAKVLKSRVKYNTVVYGVPHAAFDK